MNLYQKIKFYLHLKRKNYRNPFITAFTNNKLTFGDWYFIIMVLGLILIAITLEFKENIDGSINQAKKMAVNARYAQLETLNKLHDREKIIVTMLNSGYVRIDGVKRKFQQCDASGYCE